MIRIIRENSTGKTKELLLEANKLDNACIICKNPEKMRDKALAYGITKLDFVAYGEVANLAGSQKQFFIDDMDAFLESLPFTVAGYDLSL